MTDDAAVLQLHDPGDPRYSLNFITDDEGERTERLAALSKQEDTKTSYSTDDVDGSTIYQIYTRTPIEEAYPELDSDEEAQQWIAENFPGRTVHVVLAVLKILDAILQEKEEEGESFSTYKELELEKIPDVLNQVEWRQDVPEVGAQLLSQFIRTHPMSNTNHRTGIGLLDRYLTSIDEEFVMPDTGEEGQWYSWARDYIYDSKRILTLRNRLPLLRWADHYGYDVAERKEGIKIDLGEIDYTRDNFREYYNTQHLDRTRTFVDTVLEEAEATHLQDMTDDGQRAFIDRLQATE